MRTKAAIINLVTDLFPQVIIAILGIIKIKIFINILGNNQVGLYQLYTQILSYLVLVEGGMGTAVLFRLYKPIAEKNQEKVDSIMLAAKRVFKIITLLILALGTIIAFNIGFFLKEQIFEQSYLIITFLLFLFSQLLMYLVIPERQMFDANQKKYIPNLIYQIFNIIVSIIEILVVVLGGSLLQVIITILVTNTLSNIILLIVYRKYYGKINKKTKPDYTMVKDVKHLFVNTIGLLIGNNIDVLIISKFIGLSSVVVYTSYNYICSTLIKMIEKITGATMSGIASVIIESKKKAYNIFLDFNSMIFYIATIIAIPLIYALNPFIRIFYEGNVHTSKIISLFFVLILFYQIIKIPLRTYTFAAGEFAKVKKYVIIECIINLTLSLILVHYIGIIGVLIGTLVSLVTSDYIPKSRIIIKEILNEKQSEYHIKNLKFIILVLILGTITFFIPSNYNNLIIWFVASSTTFILNLVIVTIYYKLIKELNFIKRFNLKKMFKRR